jgi:hypothetical protein
MITPRLPASFLILFESTVVLASANLTSHPQLLDDIVCAHHPPLYSTLRRVHPHCQYIL